MTYIYVHMQTSTVTLFSACYTSRNFLFATFEKMNFISNYFSDICRCSQLQLHVAIRLFWSHLRKILVGAHIPLVNSVKIWSDICSFGLVKSSFYMDLSTGMQLSVEPYDHQSLFGTYLEWLISGLENIFSLTTLCFVEH